ncbi:MAG: FecR family protein [Pseudomonadota bacterium]
MPDATAATVVGNVNYVSGAVSIAHADGRKRLIGVGSVLENGDTVQTAQDAEAVLIFTDSQRIYLKPGSVFRIDDFSFVADSPGANKSFISLIKGGLRTISGLIGKHGNEADYQLKTKTATIGIRGTEYSVVDCAGGNCGGLPDGIHVSVYDGLVLVSNEAGGAEIGTGAGAIVFTVTAPVTQLPAREVQPVVAPPEACL